MEEILKYVAENPTYETEYAGRMETYCFFCGRHCERGEHEKNCLHLKAVELLKNKKEKVRQICEEFKTEFAPNGFIQQDEELVVPLILDFIKEKLKN